jgi:hypothetical protein
MDKQTEATAAAAVDWARPSVKLGGLSLSLSLSVLLLVLAFGYSLFP